MCGARRFIFSGTWTLADDCLSVSTIWSYYTKTQSEVAVYERPRPEAVGRQTYRFYLVLRPDCSLIQTIGIDSHERHWKPMKCLIERHDSFHLLFWVTRNHLELTFNDAPFNQVRWSSTTHLAWSITSILRWTGDTGLSCLLRDRTF